MKKILTYHMFKEPKNLVEWVNKNNLKQEDIASVSTGRSWITLYYYKYEKL